MELLPSEESQPGLSRQCKGANPPAEDVDARRGSRALGLLENSREAVIAAQVLMLA